jgi:hypothetical protein
MLNILCSFAVLHLVTTRLLGQRGQYDSNIIEVWYFPFLLKENKYADNKYA